MVRRGRGLSRDSIQPFKWNDCLFFSRYETDLDNNGLSASAGDGPPPPPADVGVGVGVGVVNDISEADERMKRYYGILPKLQADKPAEIRGTVRPRPSFVFRSSATKLTEFC